jgi:glycosyl transferase family 21
MHAPERRQPARNLPSTALTAEYVLPLRWPAGTDPAALTGYLRRLCRWLDVTVVDGSEPAVFDRHHRLWADRVRHVPVAPQGVRNGKVAGVLTGLQLARHEAVIIADDDVRWSLPELRTVVDRLREADLVRPQNYFAPLPWHARWDTARSLINRAFGSDYPGTYAVRRSTFAAMGGYDGDVLFENLELSRTVEAAGGREYRDDGLFVQREPPSARQFHGQRIRQAYDSLAQPARLAVELVLLPVTIALTGSAWSRDPRRRRAGRAGLAAGLLGSVALAEFGRRRAGGRAVFPPTAALWAPLWLAERAVCSWLALARRLGGGVPYAGQRLTVAAHSRRDLRRRASGADG